MIWVVRFDVVRRESIFVPSVADTEVEAIDKAKRILPFGWETQAVVTESFIYVSEVSADHMRYTLNTCMRDFWTVAFDRASDHEGIRYHGDYHDAVDHYLETSKVLWEV